MTTKQQEKAEEHVRVIKAGGAKGEAIVALILSTPGLSRTEVAEQVGCTVGRVGESVRWLEANGTAAEKKAVAAMKHGRTPAEPKPKATPKKAAAKKTTAKDESGFDSKPARRTRRGNLAPVEAAS